MEPLTASVVLVLSIIFIIISIGALSKKTSSRIYASAEGNPESIECEIRQLLFENPDSKIIVLCYDCDPKAFEIIKKLTEDYPRIEAVFY